MTRLHHLLAITALVLTSTAASALDRRPGVQALVSEGRTIEVYVPPKLAARPPAVVAFHWSTARGKNMLAHWKSVADAEGVLLVLPSSKQRRQWTKGDGQALDRVLGRVFSDFKVDRDRVYVTGFSGGASMAYRYFLTHPGVFSGLAPYAGRLTVKDGELEAVQGRPARACLVHGRRDRKIPYRESVRAARTLESVGIKASLRTLQTGHWPEKDHAAPAWRCLDGKSLPGQS